MYIIAGLGNPGKKYEETRHNMGFMAVDFLAEKYDIKVNKIRFRALTGEGRIAGQKVLLLKPQTYMNLSGESIRLALEYYKVNPQELIVIYDDIDIQAGMIRIRKKGSAGTHNGMRNILYHIRTEDFPRIRVGIGSGRKEDMIDYVTGSVPKNEITLLKEAADKAACGAACIVAVSYTHLDVYKRQVIRRLLEDNGGSEIKIIAKIESTQGIENFEEILEAADGIMVARGDMGVEVAYEKLPGIQKKFIRRCVQSGKIVITATQMLESMTTSPIPTRAEITDVANAVFDGTTAVMLSGETAAGKYPVEAVATMAKIAMQAETDQPKVPSRNMIWHEMDAMDVTNAVGHAACTLAKDINAAAIMAITKTGYTARRMSKFRPDIMIIGATPYEKTYHQLSLIWGVTPLMANYRYEIEDLFGHCARKALRAGLIKEGSNIVISAGVPVDVPGNTNIIRVMEANYEK